MEKTVVTPRQKKKQRVARQRIPKELIYEMVAGKPIYYRDYKKVLTKKKGVEEIMGSSSLQAQLVALIVTLLGSRLNLRKYVVMTNELGFIYALKSWRVLDIAIFEKRKIKRELLSTKYVKTAPKVVIEVDTKADLKNNDMLAYMTKKTDDLLDAGVEKVIWILTEHHKTIVAEQGKKWLIADWNDSITVLDDIAINLEELINTLLEEEEELS